MYTISLELLVRVYKQILSLKHFEHEWHFLPAKTRLIIKRNTYITSFSFYNINFNTGIFKVPIDLISLISSLPIKPIINEYLTIQNNVLTLNNENWSLERVDKSDFHTYDEEEDGILINVQNIIPALIDIQTKSFGKSNELYISNFYTISPLEDYSGVIYLRHDVDTVDLDLYIADSKFFYSILSKFKINGEVLLNKTELEYFLTCGISIKQTDKTLIPITIDIVFPYLKMDIDKWSLFVKLYQDCLNMKELFLSYEKLENKVSVINENKLTDDDVIPITKNKKLLIADFMRVYKEGKQLTSLYICDNLVLFRFTNDLDVLYTLHTLVETNE